MSSHSLVVIGGGGVGKSSLTLQLVSSQFLEYYDPTVADSFRTEITIDGRRVPLEIVDTAGQDDFASLRDSFFAQGDGFLLVYSITCKSSFEEAKMLFKQVLKVKETDSVPVVLVGNKSDLNNERKVSLEEAQTFAKSIGAVFFEASAKTKTNVTESFAQLVKQIRADRGSSCCILM
ncbi:hypothetical protein P9112_007479 [Eukaryota sp. TZLM1-RC]